MRKKYLLLGTFWVFLYTFLVLVPIIILILGPSTPQRALLQNLSVGLAFVGLAIMALQFALTARIKPLKEPFGSDIVYYYHRQIGIAAFLMIFAHPILLFIYSSGYINLLNIFTAPWKAKFGVTALLLLIGVVWLAEFRSKLKIPYWFWKIWHGIIAIIMMVGAILHIYLNGNFVNLPWKQQLWMSYLIVWILLIIYTRIIYPLRLINNQYKVINVKPERANCWTLQMRPTKKSFGFYPGQFAWLTVWKTPFSDTEHPFSLASSSAHNDRIEMTIKELGKFTATIKQVQPGQQVYVDGPYGSFSCDRYPEAKAFIFLAGGIGITPIMSMLRTLADRNDQRPLMLFYANRDWENVTFREEVGSLSKRLNIKVIHILEKPPVDWEEEVGFITTDILKRHIGPQMKSLNPEIFLCGPKPMMDAVEKHLKDAGFSGKKIHSERFSLG
jgi:predicted ferric reductase